MQPVLDMVQQRLERPAAWIERLCERVGISPKTLGVCAAALILGVLIAAGAVTSRAGQAGGERPDPARTASAGGTSCAEARDNLGSAIGRAGTGAVIQEADLRRVSEAVNLTRAACTTAEMASVNSETLGPWNQARAKTQNDAGGRPPEDRASTTVPGVTPPGLDPESIEAARRAANQDDQQSPGGHTGP